MEIETKDLLAIWASYQRSSFAALFFVRMVLATCINKSVILSMEGRGILGLWRGTD